jgi:hypothetical protein
VAGEALATGALVGLASHQRASRILGGRRKKTLTHLLDIIAERAGEIIALAVAVVVGAPNVKESGFALYSAFLPTTHAVHRERADITVMFKRPPIVSVLLWGRDNNINPLLLKMVLDSFEGGFYFHE